ncbi:MAG: hypothetical protein AAF567_03940 [Actinomycetota bacterium]
MSMWTSTKVLMRGPVLPAPFKASVPHKPTMFGRLAMERWIMFGRSVDLRIKTIAQLRAASLIGCLW